MAYQVLFIQFKFFLYPLAWNNWKIPLVSFWITAKRQCEACNNIMQPNSGALPVHLIRFFLSTVTFLTERLYIFGGSGVYILICVFQLTCMRKIFFIFRNCRFCFVLFVFLWKMFFSETSHWMSSRLGSWMPFLRVSGDFLPWCFSASLKTKNASIVSANSLISCIFFFRTFKLFFSQCYCYLFLLWMWSMFLWRERFHCWVKVWNFELHMLWKISLN